MIRHLLRPWDFLHQTKAKCPDQTIQCICREIYFRSPKVGKQLLVDPDTCRDFSKRAVGGHHGASDISEKPRLFRGIDNFSMVSDIFVLASHSGLEPPEELAEERDPTKKNAEQTACPGLKAGLSTNLELLKFVIIALTRRLFQRCDLARGCE